MSPVDTYSLIIMVAMMGVCLLHGPRVRQWRLAYSRADSRDGRRS